MDFCKGQCYDGAGNNMSGPCKGAAATVRGQLSEGKYSPKKEALLVQKVTDVCLESRRHKLLDVCKTHWIQRIDGLEVFLELYENIVATLETMQIQQRKQLAITTLSQILTLLLP